MSPVPGLPASRATRLDAMRAAATPAGGSGPETGDTLQVWPISQLDAQSCPQAWSAGRSRYKGPGNLQSSKL